MRIGGSDKNTVQINTLASVFNGGVLLPASVAFLFEQTAKVEQERFQHNQPDGLDLATVPE